MFCGGGGKTQKPKQRKKMATSWNICPPEILYYILRKVDGRSLVECRRVCKQWLSVVDHLFQHDDIIWKCFTNTILLDEGRSMVRKSTLPWRDLYRNIRLWRHIADANEIIEYIKTDQTRSQIRQIHTYKDNLIAVHGSYVQNKVHYSEVQYYKIEDFSLEKTLNVHCIDFIETDHVFLRYCYNKTIYLHGKGQIDDSLKQEPAVTYTREKVYFFHVEDDCCYMIDGYGIIWAATWQNNTWKESFLARYYVPVVHIWDLKVIVDNVYIVVQNGDILMVDARNRQLLKVFAMSAVPHARSGMKIFDKCSVAVLVDQRFQRDAKFETLGVLDERIDLLLPDARYIIEHGEMLIVAYFVNPKIEIYSKRKLLNGLAAPDRTIELKTNHTILNIEVHESKDTHCVMAKIQDRIIKITFSYPSHVKQRLPAALDRYVPS